MAKITETEFESMTKEQQLDWMLAYMSGYGAALERAIDIIDEIRAQTVVEVDKSEGKEQSWKR